MNPQRQTGGGPGHHADAAARKIAATAEQHDPPHGIRASRPVPRVRAEAFPPAGRRVRWLSLVRCCPWCGGARAHRVPGGVRAAGYGRGVYVVVTSGPPLPYGRDHAGLDQWADRDGTVYDGHGRPVPRAL